MTGREFIDRVRNISRARGIPVRIDTKRGKGSHIIVYYARRKTVVKDRHKELSVGLLSAMLRQLGLRNDDLR